MKIKFHSEASQAGEIKKVDFEAKATYDLFEDDEDKALTKYHTYHFKEPKLNEANRVEISENKVNIFAGPTTLQMVLNEKINNSFIKAGGQKFLLISQLHKVEITPKQKSFEYSLLSVVGDKIGDYKVSITELD